VIEKPFEGFRKINEIKLELLITLISREPSEGFINERKNYDIRNWK